MQSGLGLLTPENFDDKVIETVRGQALGLSDIIATTTISASAMLYDMTLRIDYEFGGQGARGRQIRVCCPNPSTISSASLPRPST